MSVARLFRALMLLALLVPIACAHEDEPIQPHDLWSSWSFDWGIVIPLLVTALLYARGARKSRGYRRWEILCFWSGWATLALALVSPLHPLGEVLFSAHMVQHEIIMTVSAPLLVLSRPLVAFLWALPIEWRRRLGRIVRPDPVQWTWRVLTAALSAWLIHAAVLWVWHIPALFVLTLKGDLVHSLQHLSFLFAALLYWWSLMGWHQSKIGGSRSYGVSVLSLFTTAIHTVLLGALLTLAPWPMYGASASATAPWGLTPLEDQQLAGLIMWVPAGIVYIGAGLVLLYLWMRESDRVPVAGAGKKTLQAVGGKG